MKDLHAYANALNVQLIESALDELLEGEIPILRGHRAQQVSYANLLEAIETDFLKRMMPVTFMRDNEMRTDQLMVFAFDGKNARAISIIRSLAIPLGFDGDNAEKPAIRRFIADWLAEMTSTEITKDEGAYIIERVKEWIRTPPVEKTHA